MDKALVPVKARFFRSSPDVSCAVIFLMFGIGLAAGTLLGCISPDGTAASAVDWADVGESLSLLGSAYKVFFYTGLALLFSTSILGVFLIPALALVRAYSLACSIAALYVSHSGDGLAYAAAAIGVPAAFSVPAFLTCACAGLLSSCQLYSLRFGSAFRPRPQAFFPRRAVFVLICLAIAFFYDIFALPLLLQGI